MLGDAKGIKTMKSQGVPCITYDGTSLRKCHFSKDVVEELVLTLIQLVPIGSVTTYSSIAQLLNVHPRAVALILRRNKRPIIYPCHRVIRSDGHIGGYTLHGRRADSIKRKLLALEGVQVINGFVPSQYILDIAKWLLESK